LYAFTIRIQGYQLSHYEAVPASGQFPAGHLPGSWPMAENTADQRTLLVLDVEMRGPGNPLRSRLSSKRLSGKQAEKKLDQQSNVGGLSLPMSNL
jgi:hypothetical protein